MNTTLLQLWLRQNELSHRLRVLRRHTLHELLQQEHLAKEERIREVLRSK